MYDVTTVSDIIVSDEMGRLSWLASMQGFNGLLQSMKTSSLSSW